MKNRQKKVSKIKNGICFEINNSELIGWFIADEELAHDWGELDKDAESTEEATSRLAICNMNWDRAKAVDLMVLFHSFLPAGGLIHSIMVSLILHIKMNHFNTLK